MADDTRNAGAGGFNAAGNADAAPRTTQNTDPEPVILEEHVIPKAARTMAPAPLSTSPKSTDSTAMPAAQLPRQAPESSRMMQPAETSKTDIGSILASVQLPERRLEPNASKPEKEPKRYDTSLTSLLEGATSPGVSSREIERIAPPHTMPTSPQTPPQSTVSHAPVLPEVEAAPVRTAAAMEPENTTVVPLHTLKDDLQHVVRQQKISVVRAVSLEEERRHRVKKDDAFEPSPVAQQRGRRVLNILFSVALLLALGGAALLGVYLVARNQTASVAPPNMQSLIFAESAVIFPLSASTPEDLRRELGAMRVNAGGTLGSITRIVPVIVDAQDDSASTRPATFTEFMKALDPGVPDELLRAASDDFFLGIHTNVDRNAPVLVVPVTSYDHAFAGMLAWEAHLNAALTPLYTSLSSQTTDQDGLPIARTFQDVIMRNYDTRALKDDAGNVQLYYSFPNRNILIIAESPYSFTEVLSRLQAERQL